MKVLPLLFFAFFVTAIFGCEQADNYLGETLDQFNQVSKSRLSKGASKVSKSKLDLAKFSSPSLPDSASPEPDLAGKVINISNSQARLIMALPTLRGGIVARQRFSSTDGHYTEEDALWFGPDNNPVTAGVLLSESRSGPPITDADDPAGVVDHWPTFRGKRRTFGDLIGTKNILGLALWRRSRISAMTCVVFLQRWSGRKTKGPASTLSGFYCAKPGETLTPGEAETVVQSLGISTLRQ